MGIFLSLVLGFVPMFIFALLIYWLDRYEKEPVKLLGAVFSWGALAAAGGAFFINTLLGAGIYLFTGSEIATELTTGGLVAPVVEESLKGLAVLAVYLASRSEFDSIIDGIVYAAVVALGFAATENAFYIYTYGYQENGLPGLFWIAFVRVILVGWQHPFYTAFTGIGLAAARLSRAPAARLVYPIAGWLVAVLAHSIHNTLASLLPGVGGMAIGSVLDWLGWFLMIAFIVAMLSRERRSIVEYLQEEIVLGLITPEQYRIACSAWSQNGARFNALWTGRYTATNRFYQTCAELAHKKQQASLLGEEDGNAARIARLRADLARLSAQISTPST